MNEKLDRAFDLICIALIGICFSTSGAFILKALSDTFRGFYVRGLLYDSAIVLLIGIVMSAFFYFIKSRA